MRKDIKLDVRQRGLIKLCREVQEPGEATLDLVMQSANFGGLTTALRAEEVFSQSDVAIASKPALCVIETGKRNIFIGMQQAARRVGTAATTYLTGMSHLINVLSKTGGTKRPVCFALDHAGNVPAETLETVFRCADETAYRLDVSVHVIVVITKIHVYDFKQRQVVAAWPKENELLKPRWRTWEYGSKSFAIVKNALKFQSVENESIETEQESRVVKIA